MIIKSRYVFGFFGLVALSSIVNPPKKEEASTVVEAPPQIQSVATKKPVPEVAPVPKVPIPKIRQSQPELQAFNTDICKRKSYLNRSKAISFSCLGTNLGEYPAHVIAYATEAGQASAVNKFIKEGKFERADAKFDTKTEQRNVCIFHQDDSAACLELAQLASVQEQEEEAFKRWDESTCSEVSPDSSIAQRTACQFVQAALLQSGFIVYVGRKTDDAVEVLRTSGYQVYSEEREFNPLTQSGISACVPYKDDSIACYERRTETP